jgi:solute carrier family 25 carnitine/acylcarnitine transporter 20/29
LTDQSLQNRFRGFAAGMASGITKLAVGHPFGKSNHSL